MPINYKNYPPAWASEIVPAVIARAENKCEECGLENHSSVWAVKFFIKNEQGRYNQRSIWFRVEADAMREAKGDEHRCKHVRVVLTIAHLDHDETNHEVKLERLKALCQACHLRYDALEKYRRSTLTWKNLF
jgi:hypothetical protein